MPRDRAITDPLGELGGQELDAAFRCQEHQEVAVAGPELVLFPGEVAQ